MKMQKENHFSQFVLDFSEESKLYIPFDYLGKIDAEIFDIAKKYLSQLLLVVSHPRIEDALLQIRSRIGLKKAFLFDDFIGDTLNGLILNIFPYSQYVKKIADEFDNFFNNEGKNLERHVWARSIVHFILTDYYIFNPHPKLFFLLPASSKDIKIEDEENFVSYDKLTLDKYPAIVFTKRVERVDELLKFIRTHKNDIKKLTENLPSPPMKRTDINIDRLALGLWLYKNSEKTNKEADIWIQKKYEITADYFGNDTPTLDQLANIKSDAIDYLNKLYPL